MKDSLIIQLKLLSKTQLSVQVLHMDERFRATSIRISNTYIAKNNWCVMSVSSLNIDVETRTICLRGTDRSRDYTTRMVVCDDAAKLKKAIIDALKEWSTGCDILGQPVLPVPAPQEDVYHF